VSAENCVWSGRLAVPMSMSCPTLSCAQRRASALFAVRSLKHAASSPASTPHERDFVTVASAAPPARACVPVRECYYQYQYQRSVRSIVNGNDSGGVHFVTSHCSFGAHGTVALYQLQPQPRQPACSVHQTGQSHQRHG
jgi:hypothetical protein